MRRDDDKLVKLLRVVGQDVGEAIDLESEFRVFSKAEVDHAGMRLAAVEDQFAEIAVVRYQDSGLVSRKREDVTVYQACREVLSDDRDIVSSGPEGNGEASIGALVQQEPSAQSDAAPANTCC